jgi:hypothetical protein
VNFVCWKWKSPTGNRGFESEHVNVLRSMIARNYNEPHKLICVTDDTHGLDPRVEAFPMPDTGFEHLPNPSGEKYPRMRKQFPSCYRRLWMFSHEAMALGEHLLCIDIDVVIVGDITFLCDEVSDFVGWGSERFGWNKIAGGLFKLRACAHPEVFVDFDPDTSPQEAARAGNNGSDQAWMSYKLYPPGKMWTDRDGLVKINWLRNDDISKAKIVFTNGHEPPWSPLVQYKNPWISRHWRE